MRVPKQGLEVSRAVEILFFHIILISVRMEIRLVSQFHDSFRSWTVQTFKTIFWGCLKYGAVRFISEASRFYGHYHKTGISRFRSLLRPWASGTSCFWGWLRSWAGADPGLALIPGCLRTEASYFCGFLFLGLIVSGAVLDLVSGCFRSGIDLFLGLQKCRLIRFWSHLRPWDLGHHTSVAASDPGLLQILGFDLRTGASYFWGFLFLRLPISGDSYFWGFLFLGLLIHDLGIFQILGWFPCIPQIPPNSLLEPSQTSGIWDFTLLWLLQIPGYFRSRAFSELGTGVSYFWGFLFLGLF